MPSKANQSRGPAASTMEPPKVKDGNPFQVASTRPRRAPVKFYAVRKMRGPGEHPGYLTIKAHDPADAKRQWFNHHNLAERSHSYDLQVVELDRNHPETKNAISVPHPVGAEGEGPLSLAQMMEKDFTDVQADIAKGPRGGQPPDTGAAGPSISGA